MTTYLERINSLTKTQKIASLAFMLAMMTGVFVGWVYLPKREETLRIHETLARLNSEINIHQKNVARLDDLRKENAELKRLLSELKEQLPSQEEVEVLLKQVDELGRGAGLHFKLWRPSDKKPILSGLYVEIPVNVEVMGGYHALRLFFDKIGSLPRIINVSGMTMGSPQVEGNRTSIQASFLATAFASLEEAPVILHPSESGKPQ